MQLIALLPDADKRQALHAAYVTDKKAQNAHGHHRGHQMHHQGQGQEGKAAAKKQQEQQRAQQQQQQVQHRAQQQAQQVAQQAAQQAQRTREEAEARQRARVEAEQVQQQAEQAQAEQAKVQQAQAAAAARAQMQQLCDQASSLSGRLAELAVLSPCQQPPDVLSRQQRLHQLSGALQDLRKTSAASAAEMAKGKKNALTDLVSVFSHIYSHG